jgi:hypothetical protein
MKRHRTFRFPSQTALKILSTGLLILLGCRIGTCRDYYQLKIYTIENEQQEERMDRFLEKAYLPALHRAGITKVGVFKPVQEDANRGKLILVLIPFQSPGEFDKLSSVLDDDPVYQDAGRDYLEAGYDNPPYRRIESILLRAFEGWPELHVPEHPTPPSERIYELRSYQGATERIYERKVEMFNVAGEIGLFVQLGFQPVFFGEVISGADMPNLMYMTTFSSLDSQQEHWKAFQASPEWIRMKEIEKYKNTVSHTDKWILHPAVYSDL